MTDTEKLLQIVLRRDHGCPNQISNGPKYGWTDCDYPECRDSQCDFWQKVDALREAIDSTFTVQHK